MAAALGPAVDTAVVHPDHPASACLALTGRLRWFPGRDVVFTWDAERGWAAELHTRATGVLRVLRYHGIDVLPDPEAVAAFHRGLFRAELPGRPDRPPGGDAREVSARLAGYAVPRRRVAPVHLFGVSTRKPGPA